MDQTSKPVMLRLISRAVGIAKSAGCQVRQITKTGSLGLVDKGVHDYQTEADRIAQRMIVANLIKSFPKTTIVGEEDLVDDKAADADLLVDSHDEEVLKMQLPSQYVSIKEEDITIWVDPLDGTTEFVKGFLEHVTVLIGVSINGKSVAGVIHQPFYGYNESKDKQDFDVSLLSGRTMWGLVGMGCFGIVPNPLPENELIITTSKSHLDSNTEAVLESLKPSQVLRVGGAGHKVLLVIEGRAHAYVFASNGCKRWDTSAPEAVLEAAGGKLTTVFGDTIHYQFSKDGNYKNSLGIVASINREIHSKIIDKMPSQVLDSLKAGQNSSR